MKGWKCDVLIWIINLYFCLEEGVNYYEAKRFFTAIHVGECVLSLLVAVESPLEILIEMRVEDIYQDKQFQLDRHYHMKHIQLLLSMKNILSEQLEENYSYFANRIPSILLKFNMN